MAKKLDQEILNSITNNIWVEKFLKIHTENKKLLEMEMIGKKTIHKKECFLADMRNKQASNTDDFDF